VLFRSAAQITSGRISRVGEYPQASAREIKGPPSMEISAGPMGIGISSTKTMTEISATIRNTGRLISLPKRMATSHSLTPLADRALPRDIMVPMRKKDAQLTLLVYSFQFRMLMPGIKKKANPTVPTTVTFKTVNQEDRIHTISRASTTQVTYFSLKSNLERLFRLAMYSLIFSGAISAGLNTLAMINQENINETMAMGVPTNIHSTKDR